jgi:hypothetical protein
MDRAGAWFNLGFEDWAREAKRYRFGSDFQQTEWHKQKTGVMIRLEDMSPSHRGNTIRLYERKVDGLRGVSIEKLHEQPLIKRMIELGAVGFEPPNTTSSGAD